MASSPGDYNAWPPVEGWVKTGRVFVKVCVEEMKRESTALLGTMLVSPLSRSMEKCDPWNLLGARGPSVSNTGIKVL